MSCYLEKRQQWQARLEQWKSSGLSIAQWCRDQKIKYDVFTYWKSRLTQSTMQRSSFIEIVPPKDPGIQLECQGVRIHLSKDFDPAVLAQCVVLLRGLPCSN